MATERVQQDGYVSKDRQISDGNGPAKTQHDGRYGGMTSQQNAGPPHHHHHHHTKQTTFDVSRAEFEQFQQQVSYNYECIQDHKQTMARFDQALHYFQQDVTRALDDLRNDIRSRGPASADSSAHSAGPKHDPRDLDLLVGQIANVTTKVNEIENIKLGLELMKTKVKRLEDATQPLAIPPRPTTATSHREQATYEGLPQAAAGPPGAQHHGPAHALPPIHTSPLPPPSSISTWRPQAGHQPYPSRPHEPEQGRWQPPVNGQGPKRPYDEPTVREQSAPASPKRPKLAPLKPRSAFGDDPQPYQSGESLPYHPPHRDAPPPSTQAPPPQLLTTPASATAAPHSYRFITATTPSEGDSWRGEDGSLTPASARGRGRGVRGRARARGGRGSDHEGDTPEWEQSKHSDWHVQPTPPHSHAHPPGQHQLGTNGYYGGPPRPPPPQGEGVPEYPLTPIASAVSPHDNSMITQDGLGTGKKTRTKPVRNSEGILIRKDGRPDMRSVSSANNLRKVHAKKEAERAELDGRTPSSVRSLVPADSQGLSDDDQKSDVSRSVSPKLHQTNGTDDVKMSEEQEGHKTPAERQQAPIEIDTADDRIDAKPKPFDSARDEQDSIVVPGERDVSNK